MEISGQSGAFCTSDASESGRERTLGQGNLCVEAGEHTDTIEQH